MPDVPGAESKWIEDHLIPHISKSFGKLSNNVHWEISFPQNVFFISNVYFLTVTFESSEGAGEKPSYDELKLVVKKPWKESLYDDEVYVEEQFHNEILFYSKLARGSSRFPRCLYVFEGAIDETAIVTENATKLGYNICDQAFDIPLENVLSAVEEIGRFHAMAYVMKEQRPEEFNRIVSDIQESRFHEVSWLRVFLEASAMRPIEWLRSNNSAPAFCDRLEKLFGNAFEEIMIESMKPVEPLATLCHGDFNRNNIFFRKNGGKVEAMLFDFDSMSYSSPAIDLATFLYLSCSTLDRVEKFDAIFGVYHKSLTMYLRDSGIKNLERYSYDKFLADYKRRAIFGFMIAVFFLQVVRGYSTIDPECNRKENAIRRRAAGGEAMTEELGRMILELRDTGCLDHLSS